MLRYILSSAAFLTAGVAEAQPAYYVAVPTAAPTKTQLMTRSTPWTWSNGAYVAGRAPERDLVLCQLVARDTGKLQSFAVAGKAFDADTLAACNSRAK